MSTQTRPKVNPLSRRPRQQRLVMAVRGGAGVGKSHFLRSMAEAGLGRLCIFDVERKARLLKGVGTKFDDHADIAPMGVPMSGTFYRNDLNGAQLRIRLTPDGRDDWSFEPRLTVTFSDNTSRMYSWPQVMLDNDHPEVMLSFSSAVQNPLI